MIQSTAQFFTKIMQRWLPNAFLFALILTLVVLVAGILGQDKSAEQMAGYWGGGIWNLLTFSMQVLLTLVAGHVVAQAPLVKRMLRALAGVAHTPGRAIVLMTLVAMFCCWLNWGFGLIASALLAREIARNVEGVHYPLLVASAYSGMLIWHAGLSGSIPLKIAETGEDTVSAVMAGQIIPVSETIFSWPVLVIVGVLWASLPLINRLMHPAPSDTYCVDAKQLEDQKVIAPSIKSLPPAERLEHNTLMPLLLVALGGYYLVNFFIQGGAIGLNTINLILLLVGLALHKTSVNYLAAMDEAVRGTSGIVLQFPLYAGIMGMMVESGLAASISQWFVSISTAETFPLFTFLSAGIVNFFVPSGGGQWAVQGPIVMPAAEALGVPLNEAAMAVAFGDAWTNMVQPFWALPLLAIAGLGIKDIMGYCTVVLLWSGMVICVGMLVFF
ncbi:short-chain fatty acid transporter [Maricurvus nonylphenolicus]|uniref:short-chain fatty acid transporter n=1 Tax=Maricurvus nonylphenolicus TaxID=1008307 RepID=UPI0036F212B6